MMERWVSVLGAGLAAEGVALRCGEVLDPAAVAGEERLAGLAIRAAHQALHAAGMGRLEGVTGEQVGLVYVSAWGSVDATVGYLESMLEGDGKHASPRLFSRSVYSGVASALAIWFGAKGPCETLAFEPDEAVSGALVAAWRLLAAKRCTRVIVVWAEQAAAIAEDLARRAAEQLGRKEYARYAAGLGEGAAAVVVGLEEGGMARVDCSAARGRRWEGKPFAMDGAAAFVAGLVTRPAGE
jgi:3-oxoacyl-(acyl-carrier-protein) synthase